MIKVVGVIVFNGFFFQAEDGIRDADVTGVQTCALPICEDTDDPEADAGDGDLLPDRVPVTEEVLRGTRSEHGDPALGVDVGPGEVAAPGQAADRKSTRLNSS